MKEFIKKRYPILLFIILLFGISYYYDYHEIILKKPQSVHKWRQSDCASIALNYYQNGMHFFKPTVHNLTSDGGTTGYCCTSEIPILYYFIAVLYKIFGYHDFIYRIINTLIFFSGLFFLFKILHHLLKNTFWAISLTILFFTSPVLIFYANNYLTNSSALAFSFIGWYYFMNYYEGEKSRDLKLSMIFFLLAGACKVTALISLLAITGIFLLEQGKIIRFKSSGKLFKKPLGFLSYVIIILIIVGGWILYASHYNKIHDCTYFSTTIFPFWGLNYEGLINVIDNVIKIWLPDYFHKSVLIFLLLCFLIIIINNKKVDRLLYFVIIFLLILGATYISLQYWTFHDHDYYIINLYIFPVIIVVSAFDLMKRNFCKILNSVITKIMFLIFIVFNIYYAKGRIYERYHGWMNDYSENIDIYEIEPYLRQIGIQPTDTIISLPDWSNSSLYLMNRKGWTEYTDARLNRGEPVYYNRDSTGIQKSINNGAKYLIINGIEELIKRSYLRSFTSNLIGKYNNTLIFELNSTVHNFSLEKRAIKEKLFSDAETISADKKYYKVTDSNKIFENGITRNDEHAFSGSYSVKLDKENPYGMTIRFKDAIPGESFIISVWRKKNKENKGVIIASESSSDYYNNKNIIVADSIGWEKLTKEFFVSQKMDGKEIAIYLYNPGDYPVFFDDFEIIRFNSYHFNHFSQ